MLIICLLHAGKQVSLFDLIVFGSGNDVDQYNHNNTGYLYSAVHRSITALTIYEQKEKRKYKQNFNIKKNTIE